jgi:hypothetical protein
VVMVDADCGSACADLCGAMALPYHGATAIRAVAFDACLDCGITAACGAQALSRFEFAVCDVAGEDQLQLVFVAAAISVRTACEALVLRGVCAGAGLRFVLFRGADDAAAAGEEIHGAKDDDGIGGGMSGACSAGQPGAAVPT